MFKKLASLAIVGLLIQTIICVESASASSKAEKEAQRVENMKARVLKLAVSKEANILVTLRDKTKVVGVISDVGEDSFVLTDPKAATAATVAYSNVTQVQRKRAADWKIGALIVAVGLSLAVVFVP